MAFLNLSRGAWIVLMGTLISASAGATYGQVNEYEVKAAFLYNFAKFVKWPAHTFTSPADPLVICVIGDSMVVHVLESTIAGKEIDGRRLVVRTIPDVRQLGVCQILFVSGSEQQRVPAILAGCKTRSVLTVGELEGFAAQGGVINFKVEDGKVRFEINTTAAAEQQLQISSKLLSLARIVKTKI
jgi:hypothetical protein